MGNALKYAIRSVVRENALARARALRLRTTERLPAAELQRRQELLLHATLRAAAAAVPAYAHLAGRIPAHGLREFLHEAVPLHGKEELLTQRSRYYPNDGRPRWWWSVGKTSGSTGTPLDVFRSLDSTLWEHAFHVQHWSWGGFEHGRWQAVLRGDLVVPLDRSTPPYWFHDRVGRQIVVSTRHLSRETAPSIASALKACGASQLRAYPSAAAELAALNDELGLGLRFRAVYTSSEMLYPVQREAIQRAFGARVFDFYGLAERSVFAMQCEHGTLHVNPEYSLVEIVDEAGRPTDDEGILVGTTLRNLAMPLLRYRANDMARWRREPCSCGRSYPGIEQLTGRVGDAVFDLDGRPVSSGVITFAFKGVPHIDRAQVAQVAADCWEVRVVPAAGYGEAEADALKRNFEQQVSRRLNLRFVTVASIPNLPSGKYKWIAQEWRA